MSLEKNVLFRTADEHRKALENKEYTSLELTEAVLAQIDEYDASVGAFLTVDAEGARASARASDQRRANGAVLSPLDGIPYGVKDNFCTKDLRTTCASRMLERFIPPYDATAVAKLRGAGAVLLGKQNMDEFAMGSSTEHSALKKTRNPHHHAFVAGGSSGGSAAAVASGMGSFALGSDTGGSVRQPASFCGVYGLKPTYGAISRYGVIEMATSLDSVGIFSRSIDDCKTVFDVLAGQDPLDATSRAKGSLAFAARPLRIAVPDCFGDGVLAPSVAEALEKAKDVLAEHGASFDTVALPSPEQALAAYSVLVSAECASNLARFDGIRYGSYREGDGGFRSRYEQTRAFGFGEEVKRRILFGSYVLQSDHRADFYERAREVRRHVKRGFLHLFSKYDLLLCPTTPHTAFRHGSVQTPEEMYRADLCTVYANLAGVPAISVPFGKDAEGMPVSVQLTAGFFGENILFHAARMLEAECPHEAMLPLFSKEVR